MSVPSDHLQRYLYEYPCRCPCRIIRATDSLTRVILIPHSSTFPRQEYTGLQTTSVLVFCSDSAGFASTLNPTVWHAAHFHLQNQVRKSFFLTNKIKKLPVHHRKRYLIHYFPLLFSLVRMVFLPWEDTMNFSEFSIPTDTDRSPIFGINNTIIYIRLANFRQLTGWGEKHSHDSVQEARRNTRTLTTIQNRKTNINQHNNTNSATERIDSAGKADRRCAVGRAATTERMTDTTMRTRARDRAQDRAQPWLRMQPC